MRDKFFCIILAIAFFMKSLPHSPIMKAPLFLIKSLLIFIFFNHFDLHAHQISPPFIASHPFEAPQDQDLAKNLIQPLMFNTLEQIRSAGLESAELSQSPWSGWYWPLSEGGLAYRYADPDFPSTAGWTSILNYLKTHQGQGPISRLSPAEKYDLLVGDQNFSLTQAMLQLSEDHSSQGSIDSWMGFCTGWALSSIMLPRPTHSVTLLAADGRTEIEFLPSDIKALGSLLWTTGSSPALVVGTTCEENPVQRDLITGRPLHSFCRDTNPATFHLAMTHILGLNRRSFLIDSDSGFQIWNQPVSSYKTSFFNPITGNAGSIELSKVSLANYTKDPFHSVRAPETAFLIGVETHLTFIYETRPSSEKTDSETWDEKRHPIYRYELELDSSGKIIGGEWLTRLHPDVMWTPITSSIPSTSGDSLIDPKETWELKQSLPDSWLKAAKKSQIYMQPLSAITYRIFDWSSKP